MMGRTFRDPHTADLDGDFVVFLIGMRVNKPWAVRRWWPTFTAMRPMIKELEARPDMGMMHAELGWLGGPFVAQYWRSFDQLDAYARDKEHLHLPAWKEYNRAARASNAVGIWHETYKVHAGEYEAIYGNMPRKGLAFAGEHVPVTRKGMSAARRIGATEEDVPAVVYQGEM